MFGLRRPPGVQSQPRNTVRVVGPSRPELELEILEPRECPANIYWSAANDGLWSNLANWKDVDNKAVMALPTANDTIIFDAARSNKDSTMDILHDKTIAGLWLQNNYAGTLTVPTSEIATPSLTVTNFQMMSNAQIQGDGNGIFVLAAGGSSLWTAGTISSFT